MTQNVSNLLLSIPNKIAGKKVLFLYSAAIILFFILVSFIANKIVTVVGNGFNIWALAATIISIIFLSFIFGEMIGISLFGFGKRILFFGRKFFVRNLSITAIIIVLGILIQEAAVFLGFKIGKAMELDIGPAKILFIIIYAAGLLGFFILLSFSSFICIKEDIGIFQSMQKSQKYVKRNYIATLASVTVFYVLWQLIGMIPKVGESLSSFLLTPILAIWFAEMLK